MVMVVVQWYDMSGVVVVMCWYDVSDCIFMAVVVM
jgi:hypothetical protein